MRCEDARLARLPTRIGTLDCASSLENSHVKARPLRSSWILLGTAAVIAAGLLGGRALADASVPTESNSAQEVVERLHAELIIVMKSAKELGYSGRFERLEPVVDAVFDTPFMAQKSIGRHWKTIAEEEKDRLLATFGQYTVANYAGRFDGYSGEAFETRGEEPSSHGTSLVRTVLILPKDDDVQLDYRLRPVGDGWKIIDVYLDGTVSELALRRSQYSSLIRREGLEALITALEEKMKNLSRGDDSVL